MFLLKTLYYIVTMRPMDFGKDIKIKIQNKINALVEGKCIMPHGFIICVDEILKIMPLQVNEEGHALFKVKYNALVFKPYENEIIDVVITSVTNEGVNANAGLFSLCLTSGDLYLRLKELHGGDDNDDDDDDGDMEGNNGGMNGESDDEDLLKNGQHIVDDDCLKIKVAGRIFSFGKGKILRTRVSGFAVHDQQVVNDF